MPLPKCVVVKKIEDGPVGWRHIGTRVTYSGNLYRRPDDSVRREMGKNVWYLAREIKWSGRLWRDSRIDALHETKVWLRKQTAYVIGKYPAAFGVFEEGTIKLIGAHPAAAGLGLAERIIRHVGGQITAGTYEDNEAARGLYKKLGMKEIRREEVFHEN